MLALLCGLLFVPAADQAVKRLLRRRLGRSAAPLGPLGQMRIVQSQIWLSRGRAPLSRLALWSIWSLCAAALVGLTLAMPACGTGVGLLLGGSLSHALETTHRGGICDYVCLRFWPAFNVADAAITLGAAGVAIPTILCLLRY